MRFATFYESKQADLRIPEKTRAFWSEGAENKFGKSLKKDVKTRRWKEKKVETEEARSSLKQIYMQ